MFQALILRLHQKNNHGGLLDDCPRCETARELVEAPEEKAAGHDKLDLADELAAEAAELVLDEDLSSACARDRLESAFRDAFRTHVRG